MKVLAATKNPGKLEEFRRIFPEVELVSADELGLPDVVEDGATFEANAAKKARELSEKSGLLALGDDSGLEVDALGGAPGVLSARYSGGGAEANVRKLLDALRGVPDPRRTARFRCVIALADGGVIELASGACEGRIDREPRGSGGFGYDPIFVPLEGDGRTMAELAGAEKDALSHRGRACRALRPVLLRRAARG
jgi:XTP/dITP diphosphohydrolase